MTRRWVGGLIVLASALWSGCDCTGSLQTTGGPCDVEESVRPPECDQECSPTQPCAAGYYCGAAGTCTADCVPTDPSTCVETAMCTADGRCVLRTPDAGFEGCAHVRVEARRVTPNVILVVDQSGSMTADFGGSNRWDALRDSLMADPDGLVTSLESTVRFGVALYSAEQPNDGEPVPGMCPLITWVPPAIDNYSAIDAVYGPADPIDETPTGESLDAVIDLLNMTPDPSSDPTIFILATDGEPDTCAQPNPQEGQPQSLAAAERAYDMGIRTFIISVGEGTVSSSHLQDMANAGLGRGAGDPDAPYWVAGDDAGLRDALGAIIGGELSCVVELNGRIQDPAAACTGTVNLNGRNLVCDDPNGWRVIDDTHIELVGNACTELQSGPGTRLDASFPCDVILI